MRKLFIKMMKHCMMLMRALKKRWNRKNMKNKESKKSEKRKSEEKGEEAVKPAAASKVQELLEANYHFRINMLNDRTEVRRRGEEAYRLVDKRTLNSITIHLLNSGCYCWDRDVKRYIESAEIAAYHPLREYMNTLPEWDGRDRLTELAHRVSKAELWTDLFSIWMRGVAAQWMGMNKGVHANSFAPILISAEQGLGKSTFARMLIPEQLRAYYTDSYDMQTVTTCERKLSTMGLINLDEFDKISERRMPQLKNLMQMAELNIKRPYGASELQLDRVASFIGTSNRRDLLCDASGSRRFLCVELTEEIDRTPLEHKQLYAQLKAMLDGGARYWLTKEEERLMQEHNKAFQRVSPLEELFGKTFEVVDETKRWCRLWSSVEIYDALKKRYPSDMRGMNAYSFARYLPRMVKRVHSRRGNGYAVKEK